MDGEDEVQSNATRTDHELMAAHVAGDPDAFTELVNRHRDRLWAVALRTTGDVEEAAEVVDGPIGRAWFVAPE